ncbi:hypothetical protein [Mycobacterium sp. BK086]|uniref:hypothetical protein n=1 Tax=Mycobacterium sp. BK086 TaxID=2512165 RepID=UPI001060B1CA|nr:hypothetical protein [Mycobacterium sp. BK086]
MVLAPVASAEPNDSGSARNAGDSSSAKPTRTAATEAKAWQDLESRTAMKADALAKAQEQALARRLETAQLDADVQSKFSALQQLSSAQSTVAIEASDADDEAAVLTALDTNDTGAALAQLAQDAQGRQALVAEKRSQASEFADQAQQSAAIVQGVGQIMSSLDAMDAVQQYDYDKTSEILEKRAQAVDPLSQAELKQQMMDIQQEVRDKIEAIAAEQANAFQGIAKNI